MEESLGHGSMFSEGEGTGCSEGMSGSDCFGLSMDLDLELIGVVSPSLTSFALANGESFLILSSKIFVCIRLFAFAAIPFTRFTTITFRRPCFIRLIFNNWIL